jgi:hypothetical protein
MPLSPLHIITGDLPVARGMIIPYLALKRNMPNGLMQGKRIWACRCEEPAFGDCLS